MRLDDADGRDLGWHAGTGNLLKCQEGKSGQTSGLRGEDLRDLVYATTSCTCVVYDTLNERREAAVNSLLDAGRTSQGQRKCGALVSRDTCMHGNATPGYERL